jgi:arylsulfatase A-like enzyme
MQRHGRKRFQISSALPVAVALLALACSARADEPRRPNIVLIVADDLGWGDVSFNGRKEWSTPNLDALAGRGTIFKRCYTAGVVCAPSRGAFLTGKATIHSGVSKNDEDLPLDEITIAEALKPLGYRTALFGKWHHGRPREGRSEYVHPLDQGFDVFEGYTDAVDAWEKFPEKLWKGSEQVPVKGYFDDLVTESATSFVAENHGKPFFLYLPFIATHFNVDAPEDEVKLHAGKFVETDHDRPLNATYAAMVTRLDKNVGRLLETLRRWNLESDTLIFFTSDHGATFESGNQGTSAALDSNQPFRGQKRTLWEGGVRVPAIASWPGKIPEGAVSEGVMQLIDLLPTFVAAAGGRVESTGGIDGLNVLPFWTGKSAAPERTLFWEWRGEGFQQIAAMRGPYKVVVTGGGKPELFDVVKDPAERRNLSAQFPELVRELRGQLDAWLKTEVRREPARPTVTSNR